MAPTLPSHHVDCAPGAALPVSDRDQARGREQTSASSIHTHDCKNDPPNREWTRLQRAHSRVFLQSAMDLSLSRGPLEGVIPGQTQRQTKGNAFNRNESPCRNQAHAGCMRSDRPATSPSWIGDNCRTTVDGRAVAREQSRNTFSADFPTGSWAGRPNLVPSGVQASSANLDNRSIHPYVWGDTRMAAAVAAATGRRTLNDAKPGRGEIRAGKTVVSPGGVQVDGRLATTRNMLRGDVFDAAERTSLPLLQ